MEEPKKEFKSELEHLRNFQEEAHEAAWSMFQASGCLAVVLHIFEQVSNNHKTYEGTAVPMDDCVPFVSVDTAIFGAEEILRTWVVELERQYNRIHELCADIPKPKPRERTAA